MRPVPGAHTRKNQRRSKISKPVVEKRRRERINHSLETLRLLMLENIDDEKLKNPKVEKAEILESVVHFLKAEVELKKGPRLEERRHFEENTKQHYEEGVRSCLLRVSSFIASKSQDEPDRESPLEFPQMHPSSPGHLQRALLASPAPAQSPPQHLSQLRCPALPQKTALHCGPATHVHNSASVWRPWPQ